MSFVEKDGIRIQATNPATKNKLLRLGYTVVKEQESLEDMTVRELIDLAKNEGISGYSGLDKADLINLIKKELNK